ncbi:MAG: serine hydrolase domain-containing protein [Pseudomonadota bacterium]
MSEAGLSKINRIVVACATMSLLPIDAMSQDDWVDTFENGLRPAVHDAGEAPVRWTLQERMAHYGVPGISIAVLSDGQVVWAEGYGEAKAGSGTLIDTETVFSVGSLSKTGTALTILRLVDAGLLDLDADVNTVLESWEAPIDGSENAEAITLRMLLSHTAGLNVHGFADFGPNEDLPDTVQILDSSGPAKNSKVRLIHNPGETYDYSGGGTTIAGLVAADKMELDFPLLAKEYVFDPLEAERSTFEVPLPEETENIAYAHNGRGLFTAKPRGYHSFPETAASGLWTTPTEYGEMLNALYRAYRGASDDFLSQDIAIDALTPVQPSVHGLGPRIIGEPSNVRMQHTGANNSYKAIYDVSLKTGDGAVIFTNGTNGTSLNAEIMRALSDALDWNHVPELKAVSLSVSDLEELIGTYEFVRERDSDGHLPDADLPDQMRLKIEEDRLVLTQGGLFGIGAQTTQLYALAKDTFVGDQGLTRVEIQRDADQNITGLNLMNEQTYKVRRRQNEYVRK